MFCLGQSAEICKISPVSRLLELRPNAKQSENGETTPKYAVQMDFTSLPAVMQWLWDVRDGDREWFAQTGVMHRFDLQMLSTIFGLQCCYSYS